LSYDLCYFSFDISVAVVLGPVALTSLDRTYRATFIIKIELSSYDRAALNAGRSGHEQAVCRTRAL